MASESYFSVELDSPALIVKELTRDIPSTMSSNAIGILFCDSESPYKEVLALLKEEIHFPIYGGTTVSFPFTNESGEEVSACLTVINKDGLTFATALSDNFTFVDIKEQTSSVYSQCRNLLGEEPKLIFSLLPQVPEANSIDFYNAALFELANGVPIFGGVTTSDSVHAEAAIFANGEIHERKLLLIMLGGKIKPVFSVKNRITNFTHTEPVVTHVECNTIFSINDDISICDYMRKLGISPEDRIDGVGSIFQYGPLAIQVKRPIRPNDETIEIRVLSHTSAEEGSATFSAAIEKDSRVIFSLLSKDNVKESANSCIHQIKERMKIIEEDSSYTYECLFCIACAARYFVSAGGVNEEVKLLTKERPHQYAFNGFYAFGEVCPTFDISTNELINRSHNFSISMVAF